MKGKRFLGILLVAIIAVSFAMSNTAVTVSAVSARITSVSYDVEKLLEENHFEPLEEGGTLSEGRIVKYRLVKNAEGEEVLEDAVEYGDEAKLHTPENGKVVFNALGTYKFFVYAEADVVDNDEATALANAHTFEIVSISKDEVPYIDEEWNTTDVLYTGDINEYRQEVKNAAEHISLSNEFTVPTLEEIVRSYYFDYESLEKVVYYCTPTSSTFTKGDVETDGELTIKLTEPGTYGFYVLFNDVLNGQMTTTGLVMGEGGWYEADEDGNPDSPLRIPVFTFEFSDVSAPEVTVKASENAYIGLTYKINAFTITADSYETVYDLYYNATKKFNRNDYDNDDEYMAAVLADADTKLISDVEEYEFDEAAMTFNPANKGYYYVKLMVKDSSSGLKEEVMSKPIACQGESQSVVKDPEFFKYNLVSIIFLGIAVLCAIALVLILIFVPKDEKKVELEETTDKK